ncbi:CocE/NonD family hydrolase [Anaerocolumna xylanovorans]|uniref:Xaa-Pro dipeptidyl-peptidase C-terminal domain-containing protein n=1 Tax=Anaerocolumna xylanovorans DSM 12503 TaxID=1121345 RepID=A0A1M7XWP5_9FIRM|nr:CocE/NonD family hydrolase [Anaerocolumna xylanovorans]SHO43202.1 hypothetical protein SAMN02745217_00129 [Anaerocolumna xylanovorans DSM 12503]
MQSAKINREYEDSGYQEAYPSFTESVMMLTMKDGINLKTYIYRPADKENRLPDNSIPAILVRSCYPSQMEAYKSHGENLAKRGYAFILQFCRGTGGSEGEWVPNVKEREDGLVTVNWLNEQSWVDAIGYWGNSYLALTGWAIADMVPEKVKGMCLTHYGTDRFYSAYEKGMFRQDVLTSWAMDNAGFPVTADYLESLKYMPQAEVDEKLWGGRLDWYREWILNTHREDEYWQQGFWKELYEIPSKVEVPLYIRSGWYDHHHGSSMHTWDNLAQEAKEKSWLDIGGWNHSFHSCLEDCKTENSRNSEIFAILEWFELVLKRKETPKQRIRTYAIAADCWLENKIWPEEPDKVLTWYLGNRTQEEQKKEIGGTLQIEAEKAEGEFTYEYDPDNPVISKGAESLLKNMAHNGSLKQPKAGRRADVLSFLSKPIEENILISGKMKAILYVSSDCPDTAFTVKIMEVRENGDAYSIRSSITDLCYDIGHTYEPGTAVEVSVDMWDIVYELQKGSVLRIDISSSDFPQYHIHSNYAGNWALATKRQKAMQKIYSGKVYASRLEIPVKITDCK